jgi:hypothetical protein
VAAFGCSVTGFGTPLENRKVEKAAVSFVKRHLKAKLWKVDDVSAEKRGYDLLCQRGPSVLHTEVKGCKGLKIQFMLTANEKEVWSTDSHFVLALVTNALGSSPILRMFKGPSDLRKFRLETISYVATLK